MAVNSVQHDQQGKQQHRQPQMGGDEGRVQAVLDGEAAEHRLARTRTAAATVPRTSQV